MKKLAEKMVKKEILTTREVKEYCEANGLEFLVTTNMDTMKKFVEEIQNAYKVAVRENKKKDEEVLSVLANYLAPINKEFEVENSKKEDEKPEEVHQEVSGEQEETEEVHQEVSGEQEETEEVHQEVNDEQEETEESVVETGVVQPDLFDGVADVSDENKDEIRLLVEIFENVLDGSEINGEIEKFEALMSAYGVQYRKGKGVDDIHDHIAQTKKRAKDLSWKLEALEKHFNRSLNNKKKK